MNDRTEHDPGLPNGAIGLAGWCALVFVCSRMGRMGTAGDKKATERADRLKAGCVKRLEHRRMGLLVVTAGLAGPVLALAQHALWQRASARYAAHLSGGVLLYATLLPCFCAGSARISVPRLH